MALSKHDKIFLGVLEDKGHIIPFLDAVFGFLYRCTDFYQIQDDAGNKMCNPAGMAWVCVLNLFKKWESKEQENEYHSKKRWSCYGYIPPAIEGFEVASENVEEDKNPTSDKENETEPQANAVLEKKYTPQEKTNAIQDKASNNSSSEHQEVQSVGDSYNGAVRNDYIWSQSILDLDVQVPVPEYITKARDVRVNITARSVSVAVRGNEPWVWKTLMEGELSWQTRKDESIWSLEPGSHIQVHFEKIQERWWDALLLSEPKIDLSRIDATRNMDDLAQDEQMKIQEIIWNQERQRQGLPTSDQLAAENILKEAWNKEGSPFLGTEYDASLVNFGNSCSELPEDYCEPD